MSAPVFLAEGGDLGALGAGDAYLLDGSEGRHAGVVQRRGPGEAIDVVDGAGTRLRCFVDHVGPGVEPGGRTAVHLRVVEVVAEPAAPVVLTLVQALAKGDRDELAVEAAVEVGVDAVVPWQAERSVVVWRGQRAAKSHAKWVATVRSATKQARRAWLPAVAEPVTSRRLAVRAADVVASGGVVVVLHEDATTSLAQVPLPPAEPDVVSTGSTAGVSTGSTAGVSTGSTTVPSPVEPVETPRPPELLVVVGPEGGISEAEVAALTDAGAVAARLGPHVLRTSTAGPVAIALLSERLGRWSV